MQVIQCEFEIESGDGKIRQTAWVDASFNLKRGSRVSFVGENGIWRIIRLGTIRMEIRDIKDTWTVGGNIEITARKARK